MARKATKKKLLKKLQEEPTNVLKTPTGRTRTPVTDKYKITRSKTSTGSNKNVRAQQFGQLLQAAMLAAGFNQTMLAEAIGCARDSVSGYCKGENIPGNERLKKIADVLGIKPEELLPNFGRAKGNGSDPRFSVNDQGNGKSWLQINRSVSSLLAARIQMMITEEDADQIKSGKRA